MSKTLRKLQTFFLFALIAVSPAAFAQSSDDLSSLDQIIQASLHDWGAPGAAVSIVRRQSVAYMKGFGVRDIRARQAVTSDTLFQIGSCTKAFTAALIAILADQGKMDWDGKVRTYLPLFHLNDPLADENVTIRDLLTHRTGLPGADLIWYGSDFGREELIRRIAYISPDAGFRARFQYQNLMFLAAGEAAGKAAGSTWDELIRQRIFEPMGMSNSFTAIGEAQKSDDRATPHTQNADGSPRPLPWHNLDNVAPAGAIISSARDMAKWIEFQLGDGTYDGKRLISEKNMREIHTPQMVVPRDDEFSNLLATESVQSTYALGWFVEDYHGHELILHPGNIDGFAAEVVLIPEMQAGYFVEVNSSGWGLFGGTSLCQRVLTYQIADKLLNLPATDWNARLHRFEVKVKAEEKVDQAWQSTRTPVTHPSHELFGSMSQV